MFAVPGGGSPDSLTESVRTNQVNVGAFTGVNLEVVPRLTATAAARYDWIRVPFEDLIDASQNGLHIFRRLSPRVGLTWNGGGGHERFASLDRGCRARSEEHTSELQSRLHLVCRLLLLKKKKATEPSHGRREDERR